MGRSGFFWLAVFCTLVLFVSANALASVLLRDVRVDLTEDRLFTLSDGTRAVLARVEEPIDVTLYYSRSLAQNVPVMRGLSTRVREMLERYTDLSGGLVRLEIVDPEPFSEAEDRAVNAGMEAVSLPGGDRFYLGVEMRDSVDRTTGIALFSPEREPFLEYDLTSTLAELTAGGAARVGVLSSLAMEGGSPLGDRAAPLFVYQQLLASYEVVPIEPDFVEIPSDLDVLLIVHPPPMTPDQHYALDQWVLDDGAALIFLDPYSRFALRPNSFGFRDPNAQRGSDLGPLTEAWGVLYDPNQVTLDAEIGAFVPVQDADGPVERVVPFWLRVTEAWLDAEDLATAQLVDGLFMSEAGAFARAPEATNEFVVLASTSPTVDVVPAVTLENAPPLDAIMAGFEAEGRPRFLAVRVYGAMESAFPAGPPALLEEDLAAEEPDGSEATADAEAAPPSEPAPDVTEHRADGRAQIVLVADSDMLIDTHLLGGSQRAGGATPPPADNGVFVLNVVDLLAGGAELVSLRSRAPAARPMALVDRMRAQADARYRADLERIEAAQEAALERLERLEDEGDALIGPDGRLTQAAIRETAEARAAYREALASQRRLQRAFLSDVDGLKAWLVFFNVWLPPILVAAVGVWVLMRRRRQTRRAAP